MRYSETKRDKKNGRNVYSISLPNQYDDNTRILTTYVPRQNERFDNIAQKFYGDPRKWYLIAQANRYVKGTIYPVPGKNLIIPRIDQ